MRCQVGGLPLAAALTTCMGLILICSGDLMAAPGDILRQIVSPAGSGSGRGMAFDGTNLYYTMTGSEAIYKIDTMGNLLATIPTTGYSCGGPLAWDGTYLWTRGYGVCEVDVLYQVDPANGSIVSQADISGAKASYKADGLDWQDSRLVLSGEIYPTPNWVSFLNPDGTIVSEFQATSHCCFPSVGSIGPSGISFDGVCLWHVYPLLGNGLITQTDLTGQETGLVVTSVTGVEDIALDMVTFAPKRVLWGMELGGDIYAIEVPEPHCAPLLTVGNTDLLHDAFPFNEDPELPGTFGFDTTTALIKTGRNTTQLTGDTLRADIPGDSLVTCACGNDLRMDFVFRVVPGPGNYVVVGNRASGLRRVPTSPVAAVPGDGSFWGEYLANSGPFGTPGGHATGSWDPNVWNSARCDTAERNLFPVETLGNLPELEACRWSATYHEADPEYAIRGIVKHRCFVVDPAGPVNSTNITCSTVPAWLNPGSGYDGSSTTKEYTKIISDGLLTPGSHVEYLLRASYLSTPTMFNMVPDTNLVYPQVGVTSGANPSCGGLPTGGVGDLDGHRWAEFSVLPDRWKSPSYGGEGMACMLYVDLDDGHGDERAWVVAADMIPATAPGKYGAHNGWHIPTPGGDPNDPNDPGNFVAAHIGQAGSTWDMFGVRGVDDPVNGYAGSIGSRLSVAPPGPAADKRARIGPTREMLWTYYRLLFVTTGRFDSKILGPVVDRSQDDVEMLLAFRGRSIGGNPRGCFVEGASFAESETATHPTELGTLFGGEMLDPSYPSLTSNTAPCVDFNTTPLISATPSFGVLNPLVLSNDVLQLSAQVPTAAEANHFTVPGGPSVVASTAALPFGTTYWTGLLDAWQVQDLDGSTCPGTGSGRTEYLRDVFTNVFGSLCPVVTTGVDVASNVPQEPLRVVSNPVQGGRALLAVSVSRPGEVLILICDIGGRRIRALPKRTYAAGEHEVTWDGRDDKGNLVRSGVYYVRANLPGAASPVSRTLVLLR